LERASGGDSALSPLDRLDDLDNLKVHRRLKLLSLLPGSAARQALEREGTVESIELLMQRDDRPLSLPALEKLRRYSEGEVRLAAERALLALGAPGGTAMIQSKLSRPEELLGLAPVLASAPLARQSLQRIAGMEGPRPEAFAALFTFLQDRPSELPALLLTEAPLARQRIHQALALTGDPVSLPVLVDLATHDPSPSSRRGAFRALAETDLGDLAPRLHRAAGSSDRTTRFDAAAALMPTGAPWVARLLVASLNEADPAEVRRARNALRRLTPGRAAELLRGILQEGNGTAFVMDFLLEVEEEGGPEVDRLSKRRGWTIVAAEIDENALALSVASRMDWPPAVRAVCARLESLLAEEPESRPSR
jgi:HEAT repeat protein